MSTVTFKEQQEELKTALHRQAVWEFLFNHLESEYLPRDGMPAIKGIRVPGMLQELVSEDAIDDVLQALGEGPIKELREKIEALESATVVMEEDEDE